MRRPSIEGVVVTIIGVSFRCHRYGKRRRRRHPGRREPIRDRWQDTVLEPQHCHSREGGNPETLTFQNWVRDTVAPFLGLPWLWIPACAGMTGEVQAPFSSCDPGFRCAAPE